MVYVRSVSSLLIMKLLAVTAKDKIGTDCKKKKCDFGESFEVSYRLDKDADSCCSDRWIGIFDSKEKHPNSENAQFMTRNACPIGEDPDDNCTDLKKGNVVFDNIDPSEDGVFQQWPAGPGKYKICHLNFADELIQKCGKVEVVLSSKIEKNIKKKAFVESTKEVYDYGEEIIADFDLVYAYPNSRVAIYNKEGGFLVDWLYTGCNNAAGDQRWSYNLSKNCIKTLKSGKVMFTLMNSNYGNHLDGGEYELRIHYYNYYHWFKLEDITDASSTFLVNPKPVSSKSPSSKSPSSKAPSTKKPKGAF